MIGMWDVLSPNAPLSVSLSVSACLHSLCLPHPIAENVQSVISARGAESQFVRKQMLSRVVRDISKYGGTVSISLYRGIVFGYVNPHFPS